MTCDQLIHPPCLFCAIATGSIPCHSIHEGNRVKAFLDVNPVRPGHTLIIPNAHYAYFDDLPADVASEILHLGQKLASALKRLYAVERVGFLFTGSDIPHVHAHLIPMFEKTDVTSRQYIAENALTFRPTPRAEDDDLAEVAVRLRATLASPLPRP